MSKKTDEVGSKSRPERHIPLQTRRCSQVDVFGKAPVPRKKEGRAARLAALMEKDGASLPEYLIPTSSEDSGSMYGVACESKPESKYGGDSAVASQAGDSSLDRWSQKSANNAGAS